MAKRLPLVFEGGEIIESKATDTTDLGNGVITAAGGDTERNLKDILSDAINVKDYGAKGDGTTDDTEAFQKAALAAAAKGGVIYVPHGTYKVTETINGEFISYGHPQFVGSAASAMTNKLTDLYNDYVHKTKNVNETITGTKTFSSSPLVPTPAATDNSQKAMNTAWLRNAVAGDSTGLSFDGNGKLKVDPSGMSPEAIKALIKSLLPGNGTDGSDGFVVDDTTGKLKVKPSELISGTGSDGLGIDGNGKIKVVPSELAGTGLAADDSTGKLSTKLKNNGGIEADSNGLYVDVNDLIPGTATDGFEVASGKLKVKPSEFAGAGLTVENGKLKVDFGDPENDQTGVIQDTLNNLMKALHLPIWVSTNLNFYVDASKPASNNVDDGIHGRSLENAWNSLDFATTTIAKNYNINSRIIYINVVPGTYNETFALASQSRTTGGIYILPTDPDGIVKVTHSNYTGSMVSHTGGRWYLEQISFEYTITDNQATGNTFPHIINSTSASETLELRRCNFKYIDQTTANSTYNIYARLFEVDGGRINFANMMSSAKMGYSSTNQCDPSSKFEGSLGSSNKLYVDWFYIINGGVVQWVRAGSQANIANYTEDHPIFNTTGSFTNFFLISMQGISRITSINGYPAFPGTVTAGKKYNVTGNGILASMASIAPGVTDGTPEPDNNAAESGTAY